MILNFLANLRGWEWLIILLVILLLFGGKKIPELMRGVGKGVHSFKQGLQEAKEEMERPIEKKDKTVEDIETEKSHHSSKENTQKKD